LDTGGLGSLEAVKKKKAKIEKRLNELKLYTKDPILQKEIELLNRYLEVGIKTTIEVIESNNSSSIKKFQDLRNSVDMLFRISKREVI